MKCIMTGNEAIARGAWEAGCHVAAAYPGTPSSEILENVAQYKEIYSEWSVNEKVALEIAAGASLAGSRSIVAMKHVGVNVAADPLFTMSYIGVNGGLVVVSADDPGFFSSQNEQDNRWYALHAKIPMLEPADSQEAKDFIKEAFELSETHDTPVLLRVTTRICHSKTLVALGERKEIAIREYTKTPSKSVMVPAFAKQRRYLVEDRERRLKEISNNSPLNRIEWGREKRIGVITSGISYQHAREVFGDEVSFLKLGFTYPLPDRLIQTFARAVDKVYVIEENEPYIENFVKSLGISCIGRDLLPAIDELSAGVIRKAFCQNETQSSYQVDAKAPPRPPVLCAGCPHRPFFYALSKYKDVVTCGDIGCYTLGFLPPLGVMDTVICMGASISGAIGFEKTNEKAGRSGKVFAVIGDSTFFHSGITGLINAVTSKSALTLCILDNRTTAMTGQQENPGTGVTLSGEATHVVDFKALCVACGVKESNVRILDPYDFKATQDVIREGYESKEVFVIITTQPCALLKDVVHKRAGVHCVVSDERCIRCKACMRVGCPAISFGDNQIHIDESSCNGCLLCAQVCPKKAISLVGEINE